MATTTTLGIAWDALIDALDSGDLSGKVFATWPGSLLADEGTDPGIEACWVSDVTEWSQEIPNIKAGRKHRQETYVLELVLWVTRLQGDNQPASAIATRDRALTLAAGVENVLADDVTLGESSLQWVLLEERDFDLLPVGQSWGCQIILRVRGSARLT